MFRGIFFSRLRRTVWGGGIRRTRPCCSWCAGARPTTRRSRGYRRTARDRRPRSPLRRGRLPAARQAPLPDIPRSTSLRTDCGIRRSRPRLEAGVPHLFEAESAGVVLLPDENPKLVAQVEKLLVSSADSVERIAERCGYNNTEHFIRQFRARTGTTPTGYRKSR